jgi:hypothetical protein
MCWTPPSWTTVNTTKLNDGEHHQAERRWTHVLVNTTKLNDGEPMYSWTPPSWTRVNPCTREHHQAERGWTHPRSAWWCSRVHGFTLVQLGGVHEYMGSPSFSLVVFTSTWVEGEPMYSWTPPSWTRVNPCTREHHQAERWWTHVFVTTPKLNEGEPM